MINRFMREGRTAAMLVLIGTALLLVGTTIALTQREQVPVTRVHLCVKDNGQLRVTSDGTSCGPSEQPTEWVVGGQVTHIRIGEGLVGNRNDGIVNLALDPSLLQTCAGCGRIFAGFNDGPDDVFGAFGDQIVPASFIGGLDLPIGDFAIFAKLTVRNEDNIDDDSHPVRCRLRAGVDFDEALVVVEDEQDRNGNGVPDRDGATSLVMNLMVVHTFAEPGGAGLFCVDGTPADPGSGLPPRDGDVKFENLKIIAVEASSISNVFLNN